MSKVKKCSVCGEPMAENESMFKFHGANGPCPKPPKYSPHQFRVIAEKEELDKKAQALSKFIGESPIFETLDSEEQERMKEQNDIMWKYSEILGKRIASF